VDWSDPDYKATARWKIADHVKERKTMTSLHIASDRRLHRAAALALRQGVMVDPDSYAPDEIVRVLDAARAPTTNVLGETLPVCKATMRLIKAATRGWWTTRHWLFHVGVRTAVYTTLLVAARLETSWAATEYAARAERQEHHGADVHWEGGAGADAGAGSHEQLSMNENPARGADVRVRGGATADDAAAARLVLIDGQTSEVPPLLPPELWLVIMKFFGRSHWACPSVRSSLATKRGDAGEGSDWETTGEEGGEERVGGDGARGLSSTPWVEEIVVADDEAAFHCL
jgi:hypothetical protein